jgi:hypothetical protein
MEKPRRAIDMRGLRIRFGLLLAAAAMPLAWAQPTITSVQASLVGNTAQNVTGITSGTPIAGFNLYLNGTFTTVSVTTVQWTNLATNATTTLANAVTVTPTQITVLIPAVLFSTPVATTQPVSVTVNQLSGTSPPAAFAINPPLAALGPVLPSGTVNVAYPDAQFITGGTAPYSISAIGGALPPGIAPDAASSGVAGTPTAAGVYNFSPKVLDFWGNTLTPALTLEVYGVPTLTLLNPASAVAGSAATTVTFAGTNFAAPVTVGTQTIPGSVAQLQLPGATALTLPTTVINATTLTAVVSPALLSTPGVLNLAVTQGAATSNVLPFSVLGTTTTSAPAFSPANAVPVGTAVTMSATVSGGLGTPTGTVVFSDGTTPIGSGTVNANGIASITTSALTVGIHFISAAYGGNAVYAGSTSTGQTLSIMAITTVTSLVPPSAVAGSPAFTLTVNGTNFSGESSVSFNGTNLASTYVSAGQMTAAVPAALIANTGTYPVIVATPGNVTSAAFQFTVTPSLAIVTTSLPAATAGAAYSAALLGTGGRLPYSWSVSGLPASISANPATGAISGVALTGGSYTVAVTLTDAAGVSVSRSFTLTVNGPPVQITPPFALPAGTVGVAYSTFLSATGGSSPYTFALAGGTLPGGLTLAAGGQVYGTPKAPGQFSFGVQVTDANGGAANGQFSVIVQPAPLAISGGGAGTVGTALSITFTGTGGVPPYTWSVTGSLPPGTSANGAVLSGTPTTAGSYVVHVLLVDSTNTTTSQNATIVIAAAPVPLTISGTLANGQLGVAYTGQFAAAGGTPPYSFTGSGLPAGLSLASSGAITGTPTTAGSFTISATVTDSAAATAAHSASGRFPITIVAAPPSLAVTTASLPKGTVGAAYTATLTATGGATPYTWSVGGLPDGLTATATGAISGTPGTAGSFAVTATVADATGLKASQSYTVTVAPAPLTITSASAPNGTVGTAYAATFAATGGVTPYTWSATGLPAGLAISAGGPISGTPTAPGAASIAVTVKDATGATASKNFAVTIAVPAAPPLNFAGISATSTPLQQPVVTVSLTNPFPLDVAVTLTLTFTPVSGGDDPTIQFATGGRTAHLTIPAGSTSAAAGVGVQTGSVAGVITIAAQLQSAGVDVTPTPAPSKTIQIAALAPVETTVTATRTSNGFTVAVVGYVTDREATQAIFQFAAGAGSNLQTTSLTVPVGTLFSGYFGGSSAAAYGGQFSFTETFTVTGSTQAISAVTVTLVNAIGSSTAVTAALN